MTKWLVAAASVAVLTFVGYYFVGEFRRGEQARQGAVVAMQRDNCLLELRQFGAAPKDTAREQAVRRCLDAGLLGADDINAEAASRGR